MQLRRLFLVFFGLLTLFTRAQHPLSSQDQEFWEREAALLEFSANIRTLKSETGDTTAISIPLRLGEGGHLEAFTARVRVRGQSRLQTCYYPPLTLRFATAARQNPVLAGQRELKLVWPCQASREAEDLVLKEWLAYRMYATISPYHYKTRPVRVVFTEHRGRRRLERDLQGFLLEDHGALARRLEGQRVRREMPAGMQDPYYSALNNLFQFLIGHTDFSLRLQHNQRLYFLGGRYLSIPYDFDLSGWVNAPYATVSNTQHLKGSVGVVTERIYKGFRRNPEVLQQAREQVLGARDTCFRILKAAQPEFRDPEAYARARAYLEEGFNLLASDRSFQRRILNHLRD